jgi:spore germination cell wall hydrolase CwlJ-like protein
MAELIVKTKNKKEEKIVEAFLSSLDINYHTQAQEHAAIYKAMKNGRKSKLLSEKKKDTFIKSLQQGK